MAPHSSTIAWKIPWAEEPGGLQSMGSLRVGYDWVTSLSLLTFMHWRRNWQPTPVFLPGESQGRGSLAGCILDNSFCFNCVYKNKIIYCSYTWMSEKNFHVVASRPRIYSVCHIDIQSLMLELCFNAGEYDQGKEKDFWNSILHWSAWKNYT